MPRYNHPHFVPWKSEILVDQKLALTACFYRNTDYLFWNRKPVCLITNVSTDLDKPLRIRFSCAWKQNKQKKKSIKHNRKHCLCVFLQKWLNRNTVSKLPPEVVLINRISVWYLLFLPVSTGPLTWNWLFFPKKWSSVETHRYFCLIAMVKF